MFEAVHLSLNVDDWPFILAKISVEFVAQIYFGEDVEIPTVSISSAIALSLLITRPGSLKS